MKVIKYTLIFLTLILFSCKRDQRIYINFTSPNEGALVHADSNLLVSLEINSAIEADSIHYFVDTFKVGKSNLPKGELKRLDNFNINTFGLPLGDHALSVRIYYEGKKEEASTGITIIPATAPVQYSFKVVNTYPHDTTSYTEGLEFRDAVLYESDGMKGESTLRKTDLKTGKVLQKIDIPAEYFAEGITVVGDKIVQLTWQENVGFVYDKKTFKKLSEFNYQNSREGWGLTYNGRELIKSDGTNKIYYLDQGNYRELLGKGVYDNKGPVDNLNELEYIDGRIYANIYTKDIIAIINPSTGAVEGEIDLSNLYPKEKRNPEADVLNGIAWDKENRRLFVTGKKWDKLFEIKVFPKK